MDERYINWQYEDGTAFHAHEVSVNFTPLQFVLDFKNITPRVDARTKTGPVFCVRHDVVVLEPFHVKRFHALLGEILDRYEKEFGKIKKSQQHILAETEYKNKKYKQNTKQTNLQNEQQGVEKMAKIIGIDLGTSNSAAAVFQAGKPTIIPSAEGTSLYGKAFPSVVAFTEDSQLLIGEPAKRQASTNPKGTITAIKRKMGTSFKVNIYGKEYTPQQISAFILQKIKKDAEEFLGEKITKAVITVPAYFDDNQRQATKDAGEIAGLEVVRIVNEPTAAALAYGLDKQDKQLKILVFDLGGGTLDVTIMEFGDGVFQVLSTSGDTQLD